MKNFSLAQAVKNITRASRQYQNYPYNTALDESAKSIGYKSFRDLASAEKPASDNKTPKMARESFRVYYAAEDEVIDGTTLTVDLETLTSLEALLEVERKMVEMGGGEKSLCYQARELDEEGEETSRISRVFVSSDFGEGERNEVFSKGSFWIDALDLSSGYNASVATFPTGVFPIVFLREILEGKENNKRFAKDNAFFCKSENTLYLFQAEADQDEIESFSAQLYGDEKAEFESLIPLLVGEDYIGDDDDETPQENTPPETLTDVAEHLKKDWKAGKSSSTILFLNKEIEIAFNTEEGKPDTLDFVDLFESGDCLNEGEPIPGGSIDASFAFSVLNRLADLHEEEVTPLFEKFSETDKSFTVSSADISFSWSAKDHDRARFLLSMTRI